METFFDSQESTRTGGQICSVSLPGRCQILPHEFPVFAFVFFKILGLAVAAEITKIKDGVGEVD